MKARKRMESMSEDQRKRELAKNAMMAATNRAKKKVRATPEYAAASGPLQTALLEAAKNNVIAE